MVLENKYNSQYFNTMHIHQKPWSLRPRLHSRGRIRNRSQIFTIQPSEAKATETKQRSSHRLGRLTGKTGFFLEIGFTGFLQGEKPENQKTYSEYVLTRS